MLNELVVVLVFLNKGDQQRVWWGVSWEPLLGMVTCSQPCSPPAPRVGRSQCPRGRIPESLGASPAAAGSAVGR